PGSRGPRTLPGMDDPLSLELPPGLTARPATAEDIPAIVELIAACELEEDGVTEVEEDDVDFEGHGLEPELDTMLVFDRDELVAWAELYRRRAEADGRPSHRARGIGSPRRGGLGGGGGGARAPGAGARRPGGQPDQDGRERRRARSLPRERLPAQVGLVDDPDGAQRAPAASRAPRGDLDPPVPSDRRARRASRDRRRVHGVARARPRALRGVGVDDRGAPGVPPRAPPPRLRRRRAGRRGDRRRLPERRGGLDLPARDEGHPPAPRDRAGAAPDRLRVVPRTRTNA